MSSLDGYEEGTPKEIKDPKVLDQAKEADATHKRWGRTGVLVLMTALIFISNLSVIWLIYHVSNQEISLIENKLMDASLRVIDAKIYLALIAGTVAEISALFLIVVKSLFKE